MNLEVSRSFRGSFVEVLFPEFSLIFCFAQYFLFCTNLWKVFLFLIAVACFLHWTQKKSHRLEFIHLFLSLFVVLSRYSHSSFNDVLVKRRFEHFAINANLFTLYVSLILALLIDINIKYFLTRMNFSKVSLNGVFLDFKVVFFLLLGFCCYSWKGSLCGCFY